MDPAVAAPVPGDAHASHSDSGVSASSDLYASDPEVSSIAISPDGSSIAYLLNAPEGRFLIVSHLVTGATRKLDVSKARVRRAEWSGPHHVLLYASDIRTLSQHRVEFVGVFSVDVEDGEIRPLLGRNKNLALHGSLAGVKATLWQEDGSVFMAAPTTRASVVEGSLDLMKVSGRTGYGEVFAKGNRNTTNWIVTPAGRVVARVDHEAKSDRIRILVPEDRGVLGSFFRSIYTRTAAVPDVEVFGLDAEREALVVGGRLRGDRFGLYRMSLADGTLGSLLYEHPEIDLDGAIVDPYTGVVVGAVYRGESPRQEFFDPRFRAVVDLLQEIRPTSQETWPEQPMHLISWDQAYNRFIVRSGVPRRAETFLLFDRSERQLIQLARSRASLTSAQLAPVRASPYSARDGLVVPAYLTVPRGVEARGLPLVVLPQPGPGARDGLDLDSWAQMFASRGYAVLQVDPRGSDGYGAAFASAGYGEWGRRMQDDVTDGVRYAVREGIADPDHVCIVGASFGGYAALAGAAFTPELYQCAVSYAGISDLVEMLRWELDRHGADSVSYDYWTRFIGGGLVGSAQIHEASPVRFADRVTASVLLIHGEHDTVVPIQQSRRMQRALFRSGKRVDFVTLDGEDHWLSSEKTRVEALRAILEFLDRHLSPPNDAGAALAKPAPSFSALCGTSSRGARSACELLEPTLGSKF